ncbi:spore germination protein GerPC [Paenibacillus protaetiae]|uniref:Uncharacterized protein n=1 Tax=Paenibacillus protaetiae TaxID=2509456 RepID=A0A4P6ETN9_9BACL|nr:spore germination protein GerPC [Paenibacillus protaetiae]QAY66274.1 hypothetical protein ET464_07520 [Paenibacillus protaetiae]
MPYGPHMPPMPMWIWQFQEALKEQRHEIEKLQKQVAALEEQLQQAGARPMYSIERLEYHFDQLKVQKLEGTLNIGMAPPGECGPVPHGDIDQFTAGTPNVFPAAESTIVTPGVPYPTIYENVDTYFNEEAPKRLLMLEQEMNVQLDPYHRRIIIDDIRKQVPTRIKYYMKQIGGKDQSKGSPEPNSEVIAAVTAKTIRDAESAMRKYVQQIAYSQQQSNPGNVQTPNVQPNPGSSQSPNVQPNPGILQSPNLQPNPGILQSPNVQPNPGSSQLPNVQPNPVKPQVPLNQLLSDQDNGGKGSS